MSFTCHLSAIPPYKGCVCSLQQVMYRWHWATLSPTPEPSWMRLASIPRWLSVNALSCAQLGLSLEFFVSVNGLIVYSLNFFVVVFLGHVGTVVQVSLCSEAATRVGSLTSLLVEHCACDRKVASLNVPMGSPSHGGDVAVYVFDIKQLSLPTLFFYSILVSVSVFKALSTLFQSINSPNNSPLSHFFLPVLFLPYWSFQLYLSLWESSSALI